MDGAGSTIARFQRRDGGSGMFPHPDTVCAVKTLERRHVLALAAREHLVAGAQPASHSSPSVIGEAWHRLHAAVIGLRHRPSGTARPSAADQVLPAAVPVR